MDTDMMLCFTIEVKKKDSLEDRAWMQDGASWIVQTC